MAKKLLLFAWLGFAPPGVHRPDMPHRREQVSCAVVLPSKAAFLRMTGYPVSYVQGYVQIDSAEHIGINEVHRAAVAEPGTIFWRDDVRHRGVDAPVLPYPGAYHV
jgi:hypothetical protein